MTLLRVYGPRLDDPVLLQTLSSRLEPLVALRTTGAPGDAPYSILVAGRPTDEQLDACARPGAVIIPFAGIPAETRTRLLARPELAVHNLHHNAAATAEMALALLLAAAKRIVPIDQALRGGDWRDRYVPGLGVQLDGRTAAVLGCGEIGHRVARGCRALGMRTVGVRRSATGDDAFDEVHGVGALETVLARADALIVCLPSTPSTAGLLDDAALARLPEGAILVNIGRGDIIDEEAIFTRLRSGALGGAGLDVWWSYPTDQASRAQTAPSQFPFGELENVVLSPHRAGHGDQTERLRGEHLARLLNQAARGEVVECRVDVERGY